jgi:glycosyltransferase involved in cell wall biosynthesis
MPIVLSETSPAESPRKGKVTVIVRSLGRPSLAGALDSVERQTYRPLEVLVVNATGTVHPPLPREYAIHVRMVGNSAPLSRPMAANLGIDNADGDYVIFLDDDDDFEPDHVESLVNAMRREGTLLAYSGTRILGERGELRGKLSVPFNRLALLKGNYIQIGAAMFSMQLMALGCRFDEELLMLQDWDFWIQSCRHTAFAFTGKQTNNWHAFRGGSGAGLGANHNTQAVDAYTQTVAQKWAGFKSQLLQRYRHAMERAAEYASKGRHDKTAEWTAIANNVASGPPTNSLQPNG